MSEDMWRERAESAEARIATMKSNFEPAMERVKNFKMNFGVRERDNGEIDIDFEKMVEHLGEAGAMELRAVIDEKYSGAEPLDLNRASG